MGGKSHGNSSWIGFPSWRVFTGHSSGKRPENGYRRRRWLSSIELSSASSQCTVWDRQCWRYLVALHSLPSILEFLFRYNFCTPQRLQPFLAVSKRNGSLGSNRSSSSYAKQEGSPSLEPNLRIGGACHLIGYHQPCVSTSGIVCPACRDLELQIKLAHGGSFGDVSRMGIFAGASGGVWGGIRGLG